jgi:hypothetical protein
MKPHDTSKETLKKTEFAKPLSSNSHGYWAVLCED